jgi:RNA polymerase sigma factor (sigma-70 family)
VKATGSDVLLWNAFREGNRDAYAGIYNLYIEDLLSYGYRVTSNRQLIKDSIQDLFLHLWLHRENLSETDSIKFYLFRSLRNRILRNIEKSDILPQTAESVLENIIEDFSFEQELMAQETEVQQIVRLQKAINKLSKRQQEVIQLRYHNDLSLEEIENLMQLNNQSVRNLLHRAISQLRISFEMAGWFLLLITTFTR